MLNFFILLLISVFLSFGISVLLVEKGRDFPIRRYRIYLQLILRKIHWKAPQMLFCTTCTSFWGTFFSDCVLCCVGLFFGVPYFFWPFSGAITAGITWVIIENLNSKDNKPDINIFIDKNDNIDIEENDNIE